MLWMLRAIILWITLVHDFQLRLLLGCYTTNKSLIMKSNKSYGDCTQNWMT